MRYLPRPQLAFRAAAISLTAAVLTFSAGAVPALAGSAADPTPASAAAAHGGQILLINGDRLLVRTAGGGHAIALLPAARPGAVLSLNEGGAIAEIPADALPYLGRGLDPSLFELTALRRAESGGRLPVRVSFTGRPPSLPGLTITRSGRGTAAGYLTASSAKAFGAALYRQFLADHARASYGADGMFAGGTDIALAGAPAVRARQPKPNYQMHTLTVTGSNLQGKPDNGDLVMVMNAGDWRKFGDPIETNSFFYHGTAKFSVPAGHYWAIGDFFNFTRTSSAERLVVLPQFRVSRTATVHVAERAATSEITTATPRRAVTQQVGITLIRGGLHGTLASASFADSGISLWVSPTTRKPTVGTLQTYTTAQLTSPARAPGTPYVYNLDFAGPPGMIPAQHYVATPASLAGVTERYYQDVRSNGGFFVFGGFLAQWEGILNSILLPLKLPGQQIQYMSAGPSIIWQGQYFEFVSNRYFLYGGQNDGFHTLPAGQQVTEDWNAYPLHPQPDTQLLGGRLGRLLAQFPSAVRVGNELGLSTSPFSDNNPQLGHYSNGFYAGPARVSGSYAVYQNGKLISHGSPLNGIPYIRLSPKPSVIRFSFSAARAGSQFPLSPASKTVWTWRSRERPGATVPVTWLCGFTQSGQPLRRCAVQPMMTLLYRVHGLGLNGLTQPGQQVIGVTVGHIQLATAAAITGAHAQVSFNGGFSWHPASVATAGVGRFLVAFSAPPGVFVTLRFRAADSAGASIQETIQGGYGTAP